MGMGVWRAIVGSYNLCCMLPRDVIGQPYMFSKTVCNSLCFQINHPIFHWPAGLHFPLQKRSCLPDWRNKNEGKQLNVLGKNHNACRPLLDKRWTRCVHTAGIQEQQHVPRSLKPAYSSFLILLIKGVRTNHCRGINCAFNSALTTASREGHGIHWVRLLWKSSRAVLSWHTTFTALYDAETELGVQGVQGGWGVGG